MTPAGTRGEPVRGIALKMASDPSTLAPTRVAIERLASELGFSEEEVAHLGLVVNEAMANVIRHAYNNRTDQPMEVTAEPVPADGAGRLDGIRVVIRDWGSGVDPSSDRAAPRMSSTASRTSRRAKKRSPPRTR